MLSAKELKKKYENGNTKKPFASTNLGIAVNTIRGIPEAIKKVRKDVGVIAKGFAQGVARSGGQIGLTSTGTKELPKTKASNIIFGDKPLTDIPTAISKTKKDLKKYKLSSGASSVVAPILVIGSIIGDVFPTGGAKRAIQEAGDDAIKYFVKTTDVSEIKKVLKIFEHPEDTLDDVAEALSKAKTVDEVKTIINQPTAQQATQPVSQLSKTELPEGQPLRQEATTQVPSGSLSSSYDLKVAQEQSSVNKLLDALKNAKPLRGEQEKLYTQARREKMSEVEKVRGETSGESGFYAELSKLKGELPKVQFDELKGKLDQVDIDTLFNMAKESPRLDFFEKINTRAGLLKMLQGQVPTNSEIKLLNQVYPSSLIKELLSKRPFMERFNDGLLKALNLPRALRSSFDLSAPLRQGIFLVGKKRFYESFGQMFKQAFSEKQFVQMQEEIFQRATYPEMKRGGLAITELDELVSTREEAFASNWAEQVPILGKIVRGSSRAYTGFLNKLRADVFDDMLNKAKIVGRDVDDEKLLKGMANFINAATGRGGLGGLERASGALNGLLFSPRLMASRLTLLNPAFYIKADPLVRKEALKSLLSFGALGMTVLGLAKLGGADVSDDPTSTDFGKIKVGDTRYDIFGGFQQYIVNASRLISGKMTSSTSGKVTQLGEGYKPITRLDILTRFFRGKENPIASFITDMLAGEDIVGEKFKPTEEIIMLFTPLIIENLIEIAKEDPELLPTGVFSIFGVGMQTYSGQSTKKIEDLKSKYINKPSTKDKASSLKSKYLK